MLLSAGSAFRESLSFDEVVDLQEGRNAIVSHSFDIDPYNPPLTRELALLPYVLTHSSLDQAYLEVHSFPARMVSILFGMGLIAVVYFFVKAAIGYPQAVFATFLITFEPTLLANSHYITMDIAVTFFLFASFALFISVYKKYSARKLLLLSICIGLGSATKITFIPFMLISMLGVLIYQWIKTKKLLFPIRKIILSSLIVLFIIWLSYFFKWNTPIKGQANSTRVSAKITQFAARHKIVMLENSIQFLQHQPIPLGDYVSTLKNNALRKGSNSCFFLGKFQPCQWYMMSVNVFLKLPLVLLILYSISFIRFWHKNKKNQVMVCILISIIGIFLSSIILHIPPLVRYVLPVVPLLIIFSATAFDYVTQTNLRKVLLALLLVLYAVGTIMTFPHFLSYANELTFGQKQFLFIDSNMDWGQSLPDAAAYIKNINTSVAFSYFGRANGDIYGLKSDRKWGSYKNSEICEFHQVKQGKGQTIFISVSNWYTCGYNKSPQFAKGKIKQIIGESIFVF